MNLDYCFIIWNLICIIEYNAERYFIENASILTMNDVAYQNTFFSSHKEYKN